MRRVDVAVLAADIHTDAWEAMADSYAYLGLYLVAVVQKHGPVTITDAELERARGFVVTGDPRGDGEVLSAVPREEVSDLVESSEKSAERLRRRWQFQYGLRDRMRRQAP